MTDTINLWKTIHSTAGITRAVNKRNTHLVKGNTDEPSSAWKESWNFSQLSHHFYVVQLFMDSQAQMHLTLQWKTQRRLRNLYGAKPVELNFTSRLCTTTTVTNRNSRPSLKSLWQTNQEWLWCLIPFPPPSFPTSWSFAHWLSTSDVMKYGRVWTRKLRKRWPSIWKAGMKGQSLIFMIILYPVQSYFWVSVDWIWRT